MADEKEGKLSTLERHARNRRTTPAGPDGAEAALRIDWKRLRRWSSEDSFRGRLARIAIEDGDGDAPPEECIIDVRANGSMPPLKAWLRHGLGLNAAAPSLTVKDSLYSKLPMNPADSGSFPGPAGPPESSAASAVRSPAAFSTFTMNRDEDRGASTRVGSSRSPGGGGESFAASPSAFSEETYDPPLVTDADEETAPRMPQERDAGRQTYSDTPAPEPEPPPPRAKAPDTIFEGVLTEAENAREAFDSREARIARNARFFRPRRRT